MQLDELYKDDRLTIFTYLSKKIGWGREVNKYPKKGPAQNL